MSTQPPEWAEDTTHYEVLGVPQDASDADIKKAFRTLSRKYHPDVVGPEGTEIIARVSEAYTVVSNPERREEYDRELAGEFDEPDTHEPPTFEDSWGEEEEWQAPDDAEDDAPTPGPGDDSDPTPEDIDDWDEDVVLDDVEVEETEDAPADPAPASIPPAGQMPSSQPGPAQQTPTAGGRGSQAAPAKKTPADEGDPKFKRPGQRMTPVLAVAAALLSVVVFAARTGWVQGPAALMVEPRPLLVVAVAAILGAAAGAALRRSEDPSRPMKPTPARKKPAPRKPMRENLPGTLLMVLGGSVLAVFLTPSAYTIGACFALAFLIAAGAVYLAAFYHREQTRLEKVIPLKSLRRSALFGRLPGGVAADLTDRTLGVLTMDKATRVVRTPQDGKAFSHAVVRGDRVAFVRGVVAPSGSYRWSGPSLLVDRPGQVHPMVATEGPYADAVAAAGRALGSGVTARAWVMVHDPENAGRVEGAESEGMPTVGSPVRVFQGVQEFLAEAGYEVDQRVTVDSVVALNA